MTAPPPVLPDDSQPLVRGLGLVQATALNVANMVGIGPFITIPLFIAAMGGPQALVGWILAAALVMCDGLVWSELGAALPGSGGTYHFLREVFGRWRWGRVLPFLFIWQFLVSGAMEIASGYIGGIHYLEYVLPGLDERIHAWGIPGGSKALMALAALIVTLSLCRRIESIGAVAVVMCAGSIVTVLVVIVAGWINFRPELLTLPDDAFTLDSRWFNSLGAAMVIAVYDYLGYYNVCHLGDEVRDPGRTIPRAVLISVVIVAVLYLSMNVAIIGVVPWQEAMHCENVAAQMIERLYGRPAAVAFTVLILWTLAACMLAITLGYSRIPYAAARNGDFFRAFARVHTTGHYPVVSLWAVGLISAACCWFPLGAVISAAVTVRIGVQFMAQIVALWVFRRTQPDAPRPFRMWLYPVPSLVALGGWVFLLGSQDTGVVLLALAVVASGLVVFAIWKSRSDA